MLEKEAGFPKGPRGLLIGDVFFSVLGRSWKKVLSFMAAVYALRAHKGRYCIILSSICLLDIASSAFGIRIGLLYEFNPLLSWMVPYGLIKYITFKLTLNFICIAAIEYGYRVTSRRSYYLIAIYGYAVVYFSGIIIATTI